MFRKPTILSSLLAILALLSLLAPRHVSAHAGGGPPFLQVNGTFSQTSPYYQGESFLNIPQDIGPTNYQLNQTIDFAIITSQLLVPKEVADASTFRWSFASGDNYENVESDHPTGTTIQKSYSKPGSYLVSVEVKAPGDDQYQLIDTVQINVLPYPGYKVPVNSVQIAGNSWSADTPIQFTDTAKLDPSAKNPKYFWDFADNTITKGKTVTHTYSGTNLLNYIYSRVIDDYGLKADIGWNVRMLNSAIQFPPFGNMQAIPVTTGTPTSSNQTTTANTITISGPIIFIGGFLLLILIIITSTVFVFKGKK